MKNIKIWKDPYDEGFDLCKKRSIQLKEGVTVLVGCNGIGKSTLLHNIKEQLTNEKVKFIEYDNLHEGGLQSTSLAGYMGEMDFLVTSISSSEGENIIMNMGKQAEKMGNYVKKYSAQEEYWFLFDAIDSGLSIDNILDIKKYLFDVVMDDNKDKKVYIVASANEYELCNGENCFDVYNGKYIKFSNYEEYRQFILDSSLWKREREELCFNQKNGEEINDSSNRG